MIFSSEHRRRNTPNGHACILGQYITETEVIDMPSRHVVVKLDNGVVVMVGLDPVVFKDETNLNIIPDEIIQVNCKGRPPSGVLSVR